MSVTGLKKILKISLMLAQKWFFSLAANYCSFNPSKISLSICYVLHWYTVLRTPSSTSCPQLNNQNVHSDNQAKNGIKTHIERLIYTVTIGWQNNFRDNPHQGWRWNWWQCFQMLKPRKKKQENAHPGVALQDEFQHNMKKQTCSLDAAFRP